MSYLFDRKRDAMKSLRDLRSDRDVSQQKLAEMIKSRVWTVQAAEYGLGHGRSPRIISDRFPQESWVSRLATALSCSFADATNAYLESCGLGDHQTFTPSELPMQNLVYLLQQRGIEGVELEELSGIPLKKLNEITSGKRWASTADIRKVANALRVDHLRLEVICWAAHYRCTEQMLLRSSLPHDRARRRGGETGAVAECDQTNNAEEITQCASEYPHQKADPERLARFGPPRIITDDEPMGMCSVTISGGSIAAPQIGKHIEGSTGFAPASAAPISSENRAPLTLAEAREEMGMSVRELARISEISTATIVSLESGIVSATLRADTKEALAEALEVTLSEFERMCAASVNRKNSRLKQRAYYVEDCLKVQSGENEGGLWSWMDMRGRMKPTANEYEDRQAAWGRHQQDKKITPSTEVSSELADSERLYRLDMATRTELGHQTRLKRENGITQKEAAARCELSERAYRRIELGHVEAKAATMRKLAKGFDVEMKVIWRLCWESRRRGELQASIRASLGEQSVAEG